MDFVKQIATFLVDSTALKFGIFKLSSGKESPYYIDLRFLPSFPQYFKLAINAYKDTIEKHIGLDKFDYFCSIPTSGLVYASTLSYVINKPLVYVRKKIKTHGISKLIDGYLSPGSKVVIIDDVVTTGNSIIDAVEAVTNNGSEVEYTVVLIDRLEGAASMLKKKDIKLISVVNINDIANVLFDTGVLEEDVLKAIRKQIK